MSDAYIIDTSAMIQAYVREPHTDHALALLAQLSADVELHIPEFCLLECANILWKHVRLHDMPTETARQGLQHLTALPLTVHPSSPYLDDALVIGLNHQLALYDSIYIALGKGLQLPLISADARQEQVAIANGVKLKSLTDFVPDSPA